MQMDIRYNNQWASDFGILAKERPNIPTPKKRYDEIEIGGRDGKLLESDGAYEDIEIQIAFNYISKPEMWSVLKRKAKQWLLGSGSGELFISDDPYFFYKVKNVEIGAFDRTSLRVGNFTATFLCEPFEYAVAGKEEYAVFGEIYNHFYRAHPVYKITGNGTCVLYVNEKKVEITVSDNVTIDTDKMMAYKGAALVNATVKGDYESLFLETGRNTVRCTEGFTLKIIPNWRSL